MWYILIRVQAESRSQRLSQPRPDSPRHTVPSIAATSRDLPAQGLPDTADANCDDETKANINQWTRSTLRAMRSEQFFHTVLSEESPCQAPCQSYSDMSLALWRTPTLR